MTRQTNDKNQIWYTQQDRNTQIGFTKDFLNSLDQCWHILPASLDKFRTKAPLLTVETNDALISIMSPVAGNLLNYSQKAQNFPDKLTEEDVVLELHDGPPRQQPVPAGTAPRMAFPPRDRDFVEAGAQVAPQPPRWVAEELAQAPARLDVANMRQRILRDEQILRELNQQRPWVGPAFLDEENT